MALYDLMLAHTKTEAENSNWTDALAILEATSTTEVVNQTPWTIASIMAEVGETDGRIVAASIQAAADVDPIMASAWIALSTGGLSLHAADRQAMIDGLSAASGWTTELTDKVKALGRSTKNVPSILQKAGLSGVTEADLQASWEVYRLEKAWSTYLNDTLFPAAQGMNGDSTALVAALRTAADEIEAL